MMAVYTKAGHDRGGGLRKGRSDKSKRIVILLTRRSIVARWSNTLGRNGTEVRVSDGRERHGGKH